ncbi:dTDP-4-dehydrorhamnose 3,5-epimerase family protein [Actinoplanes sp. NPDC048791]|uniref:dTDP-4-dehydrorhamnose 3,5-epimerase family protein n=1 Tax=Actinoplanes sp. NPDC048791 TaxID=3154623 RepID=UPI0033C60922
MKITPLAIAGAWEVSPVQNRDDRGVFLELYRDEQFSAAVGYAFPLAQANVSVSAKGVVRGIHYADVPPGQAKYVTCVQGAVFDVIVDIRVGSPTFGRWEAIRLDDTERHAVYLSSGLGHGFCALTDNAAVTYFCSTTYHPSRERAVHPLDSQLAIDWPVDDIRLSSRDMGAPSLAGALEAGLLPPFDSCRARREA